MEQQPEPCAGAAVDDVAAADDFALLGQARRVELLAAIARSRAALDAQEQRLLHAMATDRDPYRDGTPDVLAKQWVREEVACALRIAPQTAQAKLVEADVLVTRLPATLVLLGRGELSMRHASRLVDAVLGLPDVVATAVQARVLTRAPVQTPAQFAASVRRAVLALDPREPEQRHQDALAGRRVVFRPNQDGTTELWALLPADTAAALKTAIDQRADQLHAHDQHDPAGQPRTADQRRADALLELALGTTALTPTVNVTVALSTLLDLDGQPGHLDGHGPIPAALARALAFDPTGTWRRLLTDPHGHVIDAGRSTYRPPAALARLVIANQTTCVFPGCRRTAARCDLDHIRPWHHGGQTHADNLQPLCRRHHHLKHEAGWHVSRLPDGTTRWQAPTGHTYDRPPDEIPRDTTTDPPDNRPAGEGHAA